jgi:hypothetical protein
LFSSRFRRQPHLSTRPYARIVHRWVERAGLDSSAYGTHSLRRTKAAQIYRNTGNLRAVQLLFGHTKLESTVRYLGIEVDALTISEQVELWAKLALRPRLGRAAATRGAVRYMPQSCRLRLRVRRVRAYPEPLLRLRRADIEAIGPTLISSRP